MVKRIKYKTQSGVTLVALGITIVVLMIIAGITISMLTGDHGIVKEAESAHIQTEVSKLQEITELYVRSKGIERAKERDYSDKTLNDDLRNIVTEVITKDNLNLGIYRDFKTLDFNSKFGKGGQRVEYTWSGDISDLEDCFVINLKTKATYYVANGKIWDTSGITSAEKVKLEDDEYGEVGDLPTSKPEITPGPTQDGKYTVVYNYTYNGGTELYGTEETVSLKDGEKVNLEARSHKEGYQFIGWSTDRNSHDPLDVLRVNKSGITLYALFRKEIKATFNFYNSDPKEVQATLYNRDSRVGVTSPQIPDVMKNEENYVGSGWSRSEDPDSPIEVAPGKTCYISEDTNYYAVYALKDPGTQEEEVSIVFNFYKNGNSATTLVKVKKGINHQGTEIGGVIEIPAEVSQSVGPEDTKYAYVSTTKDGERIDPSIKEGTEYYAVYSKDIKVTKYTYNGDSEEVTNKIYGYYDGATKKENLNLGTSDEIDGYKPKGWATEEKADSEIKVDLNGEVQPTTESKYYMVYSKDITVSFDANEGSDPPENITNTILMNYTGEKKLPMIQIPSKKPSREQHAFLGWVKDKDSETAQYLPGKSYEFEDSTTLFAKWTDSQISADIDTSTFGDFIDIDVDLNGNEKTSDDWKIFYNDGTYVYLISADYLPNSKFPQDAKLSNNGYKAYWSSPPDKYLSGLGESYFKDKFFTKFDLSNTNNNARAVSTLLDTSIWQNLKGKFGEEVVGAPPIELFIASYNAKYGDNKLTCEADRSGYKYTGNVGSSDPLYNINSTGYCNGYWLAAPASNNNNSNNLVFVQYNGTISNASYSSNAYGLRPVVRLSKDFTVKKGDDKVWRRDTTLENINETSYGEYVAYNIDLNDDRNTTNDWKIFFRDDENVYLIAADYLPNSKIPNEAKMTKSGNYPYNAYWGSSPEKYLSQIENSTIMPKYFTKFSLDSTNNNARAVSSLLDPQVWKSFKGRDGEEAIGSPTIEMLMQSYNARYGEGKISAEADNRGIKYTGSLGTTDSLYTITSTSKANGYMLASPYQNSEGIIYVTNGGGFSNFTYTSDTASLRPVIKLNKGTTGDNQDDGIWRLVSDENATVSKPTIELYPTGWTKDQVEATIYYPDEATSKKYSYDGDQWNDYKDSLIVSKNETTIYAKCMVGSKEVTATKTITTIDNEEPTVSLSIGNVTSSSIELIVDAKDTTSGIDNYRYLLGTEEKKAESKENRYTFYGLENGQEYDLKVEVKDRAGNTKEESIKQSTETTVIDTKNYGEFIEYNVDLNGNQNMADDWKIFYNDGTYTYLISADYLPSNKLPQNTTLTNSNYRLYWNSVPEKYLSQLGSSMMKDKFFTKFSLSNTSNNAKCISTLLDTEIWSSLKGKFGEEVIGSPTIEMLSASYNAKYGEKVTSVADSLGYSITGSLDSSDRLYTLNTSSGSCSGYWLATPAKNTSNSNYIYFLNQGGSFGTSTYNTNSYGVRPVIRLRSDIDIVRGNDSIWRENVNFENLDSTMYGDFVTYNVDLNNNNNPSDDWKIFYNDGTNIYLIAADYLLNSKVPSGVGMQNSGSYTVRWSVPPEKYLSQLGSSAIREKFFTRFNLNSTSNNAKCVASLLDTKIWEDFRGKYGEEAIGSPTIEMLATSYNSKYGEDSIKINVDNKGYTYEGNPGTKDSLYTITDTSKTSTYWLATPASITNNSSTDYLHILNSSGNFTTSTYSSYCGLRPVIRLKEGVTGTNSENGIWTLKSQNNGDELKATIELEPNGWTKTEVLATIYYPEGVETKEFSYDGSSWQPYQDSITISENRDLYARSNQDDTTIVKYTIDNIDNDIPDVNATTGTVTSSSIEFTVNATDKTSGIDSYTYYLDDEKKGEETQESKFTFYGLETEQQYTLKVVVKDKAGNENEYSLKTKPTKQAIDTENFGDFVDYNIDLNDNGNTQDDWRIFYNDGQYIYLISSDYLKNSKIPDNIGITRHSSYHAYWSTIPDKYLSDLGKSVIKDKFFTQFSLTNTNNNAKATATLLDSNNWNTLKGKYGAEIIGSPTIELFMASYNAKHGKERILTSSADSLGYKYQGNPGTSDNLYTITNTGNCNGMWFASPAYTSNNTDNILFLNYDGNFSYASYSNSSFGIRPVIRLSEEYNVKKGDDGIWRIDKSLDESDNEMSIGDFVSYDVDLNNNNNFEDDWKVFYRDEENIYIISSDFLPVGKLPSKANMATSSSHRIYWSSVPEKYLSNLGESIIKTKFFTQFNLTNTNNNARATATLLDTEIWDELKGKYGEEAIGSPTVELLAASYNEKYGEGSIKTSANEVGYTAEGKILTSDPLYSVKTNGNCSYYWLASPSAQNKTNTDYLMAVDNSGNWNYLSYNYSTIGIRPVIRLNPDVTGQNISNGIWRLTSKDDGEVTKPKFELDNKKWTNEEVTVKIDYGSASTREYSYTGNEEDWVAYDTPLKVQENSTIYAKATSGSTSKTSSINITNIDTKQPEVQVSAGTVSSTSLEIKVDATDSDSGISTYQYYLDETQKTGEIKENKHSYYGLSDSKQYNMKVIVKDVAGNTKEASLRNKPMRKTVDPSNFGDYIDYNVDLNDNGNTTDDWRIFYKDNEYVYIISANYLQTSKLPLGHDLNYPRTIYRYNESNQWVYDKDHNYAVRWEKVPDTYLSNLGESVIKDRYFSQFKLTNTNINSRHTTPLLNTENWTSLKGKYADEVIGTPTIEMFVNSYNSKYGEKLTATATEKGYTYSGSAGTGDNLYYLSNPGNNQRNTNLYTNGYWLASPYQDTTSLIYVNNSGAFTTMNPLNASQNNNNNLNYYIGIRPVIRLNPGYKITQGDDHIWRQDIGFKELTETSYGDYVSYDIDLNNNNNVTDDWRILYNDNEYVYIIAANYLLNSKLPKDAELTAYSSYGVYWPRIPDRYLSDISKSFITEKFFKLFDLKNTNNNAKAITSLLDNSYWSSLKGRYGEEVIGSPTLELLVNSYNQKYGEKITISADAKGYKYSGNFGSADYLYTASSPGSCSGYWVTAPYGDSENIIYVNSSGSLTYASPTNNSANIGIRPVIRLKKDLLGTDTSNGIWRLNQ